MSLRLPKTTQNCMDGRLRCRAMRRLLIASVIAMPLGGCVLEPILLFDARQTGGDNAMRSNFSDADVQFRNGDKNSPVISALLLLR